MVLKEEERRLSSTLISSHYQSAEQSPTLAQSHPHVCTHAQTHTVSLLQDDGRNNIGLIVKHIKGKHILHEATWRMKEYSNSNSFVSLREYT